MDLLQSLQLESFKATLSFARLAILLLFVACLVTGAYGGVAFVVICTALSYVAQMLYTQQMGRAGLAVHVFALASAVVAFCLLVDAIGVGSA